RENIEYTHRDSCGSIKGDQPLMSSKTPKRTLALRAARISKRSIGRRTGGAPNARLLAIVSLAATLTFGSVVSAKHFGDRGARVMAESTSRSSSELNTTSSEGAPIQSSENLSLDTNEPEPNLTGENVILQWNRVLRETVAVPGQNV